MTSADGTRLRLAQWGSGPRDVLLVHGLAEHAERYAHVGEAFANAGFTATLVELRGHGHSGGARGYISRWSEYVDDVRAATGGMRPGWTMLAHSMGGLVALESVSAGICPARVALSNPLLGVSVKVPAIKVFAAKCLSRLVPTLALKNDIPTSDLSRDPAIGAAYATDPLVFNTATARWYTEMVAAMARAHAGAYTVPLAMFVGADDHITDPSVNKDFALRNRAHLKVYPDFRHEIVNEIGKEAAIHDIVGWLGEEASCATA